MSSYDYVPIRIFAGVNRGFSEDTLQDGEASDARNFLFRRREAVTRPGLKTYALSGLTGDAVYARSFLGIGSSDTTHTVMSNGKLYRIASNGTATEITGPGTTFDPTGAYNSEVVNRVVLAANNIGGILRWDPTGTVYTVMADAPFRYVTSHTVRAVAAYRLDASGPGDPITVAWSDEGDETVWATGGTSTAGSTILVDMPGDITGLTVLHNLVVVCRNNGFHIGYPTGTVFPAFRFEPWSRRGPGVLYPETLASDDNTAFYVGEDDVYTFDLQQINPIGLQVRDQLIALLEAGYKYNGWIARKNKRRPRFTYHLTPIGSLNAQKDLPHFIYDVLEQTWSICSYDAHVLQYGFQRNPTSSGGVSFIDSSNNLQAWDDATPLESNGFLELPNKTVGQLSKDYRVDSALVKYRNYGDLEGVTVGVNGALGTLDLGASAKRKLGSGPVPGSEQWQRAWFRLNTVGQGFVTRIDVDPGTRFATNYLELRATEAGEFKGELL